MYFCLHCQSFLVIIQALFCAPAKHHNPFPISDALGINSNSNGAVGPSLLVCFRRKVSIFFLFSLISLQHTRKPPTWARTLLLMCSNFLMVEEGNIFTASQSEFSTVLDNALHDSVVNSFSIHRWALVLVRVMQLELISFHGKWLRSSNAVNDITFTSLSELIPLRIYTLISSKSIRARSAIERSTFPLFIALHHGNLHFTLFSLSTLRRKGCGRAFVKVLCCWIFMRNNRKLRKEATLTIKINGSTSLHVTSSHECQRRVWTFYANTREISFDIPRHGSYLYARFNALIFIIRVSFPLSWSGAIKASQK